MRLTTHMKQLFLIFIVLLISCNDETSGDRICQIEIPPDTYYYPMTPDNPDWNNLSPSQIWEMNQLPDSIIKEISTQGLLESCLTFPYYGDIGLSDYHQNMFQYYNDNFNGIYELLNRRDASIVIFDRYKGMSPLCINNNYPVFLGRGESVGMAFIAIEMILAQYDILNHFNSDQLKDVVDAALSTYYSKCKNKATYSIYNTKFTLAICGRILIIENYQPFVSELNSNPMLQLFLDQIFVANFEPLEIVLTYTEYYLKGIDN